MAGKANLDQGPAQTYIRRYPTSNLLKFRRLFGNRHTICLKVIELEIVVMVMIVMVMVVNRVNQTFNGKRY